MTISGMAPCSLTYSFVTRRTRLNLAKSSSAPAGDEKIRSGGMARVLIGTSGWHYDSWRGPFYPKGATPKGLLCYYASQFQTTEPNGVFYRTPTSQAASTTPDPRIGTRLWVRLLARDRTEPHPPEGAS